MQISKGTSIVDTKEYIDLINFQEAMEKNFVMFEYNDNIWFYDYSKDDFLEKHKVEFEKLKKQYEEENKTISKRFESQYKAFYKMADELHETNLKLIDTEAKLEKASKFSLSSFLVGFFTLLATYSTIMLLTKYLKWY